MSSYSILGPPDGVWSVETTAGSEGYCIKLTLDEWLSTNKKGVEFYQNNLYCPYVNPDTYLRVGGYIVSGVPTTLNMPRPINYFIPNTYGINVDITVIFKNSAGTTLSTITHTLENLLYNIVYREVIYPSPGEPTEITLRMAVWIEFNTTFDIPIGSATVDTHYYFWQDKVNSLIGAIDGLSASPTTPLDLGDSYAYINREIIKFNGIVRNVLGSVCLTLPGVQGRGELGSYPVDHKIDDNGRILKAIGGATKAVGHPLNILMRLLTTTSGAGVNGYYDAGDTFGLGIPQVSIDIAAIEALRDNPLYADQRVEFRVTQGIKNFKEWSESEIMRVFGYRWVPGTDGKISVARISGGPIDQERVGTFSAGPTFTPTTNPSWIADRWNGYYLWVKELALVYPISDGTTSALIVTGGPTSGVYTCAIVSTNELPYVATIEERDMESMPIMSYNNNIINSIDWQYDYDPSNSVDNRLSTRLLSLLTHDESTFFDSFSGSSLSRYGVCDLTFKSTGLRGVGAAQFATGYDLQGNIHSRKVSYDLIRRWREQLPTIKLTSGAKHFPLDAGDIVRVIHSKVKDISTGATGIDKLVQVSTLRFDSSKRKLIVEGVSLSDIKIPPLKAPITFPTFQDYFISVRQVNSITLENLGIKDYPTQIADMWFIAQTYGSASQVEADGIAWGGLVPPNFTGYRHTNVYTSDKFYDALRAGTFSTGPTFTPTVASTWTTNQWVGYYLWVKETNILYPITSNTATSLVATGAPTSGAYNCAITSESTIATIWGRVAETNKQFVFFLWKAGLGTDLPDGPAIKITWASYAYNPLTGDFQESAPIYKFYVGTNRLALLNPTRFSQRTAERVTNYKLRQLIYRTEE